MDVTYEEHQVPVSCIVNGEVKKFVEDLWLRELARKEGKSGKGGNKLRTYALFKKECCFEPYLMHIKDWRKRALYTRFRSGVAPLRIETGRYEASGSGTSTVPVDDRVCLCCNNLLAVEDEKHFLCTCPVYNDMRCILMNACIAFNHQPSNIHCHIHIHDRDRFFIDVLSCMDYSVCNAVANYIWSAFEVRTHMLDSRRQA